MIPTPSRFLLPLAIVLAFSSQLELMAQTESPSQRCLPIERRLPPEGLAPQADQEKQWKNQLEELKSELSHLQSPYGADIECLLKACQFALDHHEFYRASDFKKMERLLTLAQQRLNQLPADSPTWAHAKGLQVRGYRSSVDGSAQPIGLVFPETGLPATASPARGYPLYVWLHGRGDKTTDLHFIVDRLDKTGQIQPPGAIVLHPFGRQCIGYKSAGETDVMEAIDFVCQNYPIDQNRIVLMGFSMGGAGVWHLAAHYGDRFVAASPGAGFAETARYQNLQPDDFPPAYEQMLWSVYDVPGYVRNLFNLPLVAYSGENDKQIQAARVMEEAFAAHQQTLPHLIGPGMGHKYHPDTLQQLLERMNQAVEEGRPENPSTIHIQSPHPRYAQRRWLTIDGASQQYVDTRVDARRNPSRGWELTTQNAKRLVIETGPPSSPQKQFTIDGQIVPLQANSKNNILRREDGEWQPVETFSEFRKHPGISGPIDDAFIDPFLVVLPSGKSSNAAVQSWIECESAYFANRWKSLYRGTLRSKLDREVTDEDQRKYHLVLWGTPESNSLISQLFHSSKFRELGATWSLQTLGWDAKEFEAKTHILQLIYPNPLEPSRYIVLNSGPTFRPAHDRTNSLQNPKLPDWNILSVEAPRTDQEAGKTVRCGFFDDAWHLESKLTW